MKEQLEQLLAEAIGQLKAQGKIPADHPVKIQLDRPRDKSHGDFATNLALMLAKPAKSNPRQLAEAIVDAVPENSLLSKMDIAGPGFINFTISQDQLKDQLTAMLNSDRLNIDAADESKTIVIDYSSPNLAKEMHMVTCAPPLLVTQYHVCASF